MFQFPAFASYTYGFSAEYLTDARWVSPFGHLRINACLSTPRSFSQTTTSFIASSCQGIHRMHLITWPYNPKTQLSYKIPNDYPSLDIFSSLEHSYFKRPKSPASSTIIAFATHTKYAWRLVSVNLQYTTSIIDVYHLLCLLQTFSSPIF